MSTTKEINSIVKIKKIKQKLPTLGPRSEINHVRGGGELAVPENTGQLESPIIFTALTYDDTKDVIIEDTSAVLHTIKTVATAKIVDANGKEILIDEVIFTPPP